MPSAKPASIDATLELLKSGDYIADRSLATVTALIAMNRLEQLPGHMTRALANGVTREEIIELITHLAFYSGWPNSMSALSIARKVFDQQAKS